jgi:hypothetical protein
MAEDLKYKIKGKIVNSLLEPLSEATIKNSINDDVTVSQPTGDFTVEGTYPSGSLFTLSISATNYTQLYKNPFRQNGKFKKNLGVIKMTPTQIDLSDSISNELPLPQLQVKAIKLSKIDAEMAKQQAMNQVITTIKTVLIPAVLTQLAAFGISKASEALTKNFKDVNVTCPANLDELNDQIARKNKLVRQLNNIYNFLNGVKIGVQILDGTLTAAQITVNILKAVPPPSAVAQSSILSEIETQIKKYKLISSTTLIVLNILIAALQQVLAYLSLLDQAIGECAIEGALPQEQLTDDLLVSTQEQSNQLSPVVTNVNGFDMDVISIDGDTNQNLKQRRAVARNSQGIVMLQGEPSYSSNDQILIDELVFYIQQNDLKA